MRQGAWTAQYTIHSDVSVAAAFTNMPSAETFLFSSHRHIILVDTTGMTYVRLKVNKQATNGSNGAKLILRYSQTFSTVVSDYRDIGITEVSVPIDNQNTYMSSQWIEINQDVTGLEDVYLAVIGVGGNGNADPAFGNISVSFC